MRKLIGDRGRGILTSILVGAVMVAGGIIAAQPVLPFGGAANSVYAVEERNVNNMNALRAALDYAAAHPSEAVDIHIVGNMSLDGSITIHKNVYLYINSGVEFTANGGQRKIINRGALIILGTINISNNVSNEAGSIVAIDQGKVKGNLVANAKFIDLSRFWIVTFDANGGSLAGGLLRDTVAVEKGKSVSSLNTSREGYEFVGWFTGSVNGVMWDFSNPVTGSMTLYAHWRSAKPADVPHGFVDRYFLGEEEISEARSKADGMVLVDSKVPAVEGVDGSYSWNGANWAYVDPVTEENHYIYEFIEMPTTDPEGNPIEHGYDTRYYLDGEAVDADPIGEGVRFDREEVVPEGVDGYYTWNAETETYDYTVAVVEVTHKYYESVEKPTTTPEGDSLAHGSETIYYLDDEVVDADPTGEGVRFVSDDVSPEGVDGYYTWNTETEDYDYTPAVTEIVHRYYDTFEVPVVVPPVVITPFVPPVVTPVAVTPVVVTPPVVEEPIVEEPVEEEDDDEEDIVTAPEERDEESEVLGETDGGEEWALVNLLLTVVTGLVSLVMIIAYFGGDEDDDEKVKRHGLLRVLTLVPLAGAVVAFIMTEDMSNPMGMVDTWTILMVGIVAVQVVLAVLARKSTKKNKR